MSTEVKSLQIEEMNDVKILLNEEKVPAPARKREKRFAELLENFWREDELAEAAEAQE